MRRLVAAFFVITLASAVAAEEITVDKILAAVSLGAPAESIIAKINDPANTVPAVGTTDVTRLQAAGVPDAVIQALVARAPQPTAAPPPVQPDNPNLVTLVRLVKSGLSEKIIADQIRENGVIAKPTVNDLLYLKENGIQEVIIVALMEAPVRTATTAQAPAGVAAPNQDVTFDGLVFKKGGVFVKNRTGQLLLQEDKLRWRDSADATKNFELFVKGSNQLTVACIARQNDNFCYGVTFEFTKGDDYEFEDAKKDAGGNENLMLLLKVLKQRYPDLPVIEKVKSGK